MIRQFMLNSIFHFSTNPYRTESDGGKRQMTGLYLVMIIGMLFSIVDFLLAIGGYSRYECIPGDLTLAGTFLVGFLYLRHKQPDRAVNIVYLIPFSIYFFFISEPYAIRPVHATIEQTLWSLIPGFLFILFFGSNLKKLVLYFIISAITLIYHLQAASQLTDVGSLYRQQGQSVNPLIVLVLVFAGSLLIAWNFEKTLRELKNKVEDTDAEISRASRMMQQGLLVMKIKRDEVNNPVGLRIVRVNQAFESIFDVGARELRNMDAEVIFPKIFRDSFDWNSFFLQEKKQKLELHLEHLHKWVELGALYPAKDQVICFFFDITPKQQQIMSLEESSNRYKVLLEAIPDLFFIIDKDGIYIDFVIKESELIQIKPDDIIGNSIFEVGFSEKMSRKIFQCIQDAISFDTIETIEYALKVEKGTAMFEMRIARLNDHSVISIARDITKRKVAEMKLEEAKQKAEEANELKSAFLANISHEIRTPMNAIIGFSRMIGSPDFDEEEKNRFVDIIISNGKLLMEMINNMISISKIESNQVVPQKDFCKINDLMVELYREYSLEVSNKPVRLKLKNENADPKFGIITDKQLLTEILKQLIDNAIKFTHEGEVQFGYRMGDKTKLCFFVKDTGIGIEPRNIGLIFERFLQIDHKTTRKYEGTGLGLAIARYYIMLLGGKIEVQSEIDKGSEFSFCIPVEDEENHLKIIR